MSIAIFRTPEYSLYCSYEEILREERARRRRICEWGLVTLITLGLPVILLACLAIQ